MTAQRRLPPCAAPSDLAPHIESTRQDLIARAKAKAGQVRAALATASARGVTAGSWSKVVGGGLGMRGTRQNPWRSPLIRRSAPPLGQARGQALLPSGEGGAANSSLHARQGSEAVGGGRRLSRSPFIQASPRHEADRHGVGDVDEEGRDQRQDDEGAG